MKILLIILLLPVLCFGQKSRVEKRNGIWFYIEETVISDTSQIPDPSKPVPPVPNPNPNFPGPVINVSPGQSIKSAVERATAGTWVVIAAGTYNEADMLVPPGVNIWGVGNVIVNATTALKYGERRPDNLYQGAKNEDGTHALFMLSSDSRTAGNQRIHNLDLRGGGKGIGGLIVNQRNNVVITDLRIDGFNFSGLWVMYSDNSVVSRVRLNNNSWISTGWASGEFNWVETNNCLFRDIITTSNSPNRGYGFKVLWSGKKNIYNNTFRKIQTKMNHASNWNNGQSHNIGFEMHDCRVAGNVVVDSSYFENQISLVFPEANTGTVTFQNSSHDGKNDRYTFELFLDNFTARNFTSVNSSQFSFNVETSRPVKNWLLQSVRWTQGAAPTMSWGAPFLFSSSGKENIVLQSSTFTPYSVKPNTTGITIR